MEITHEEEIRERIVKGNKAIYTNRALFKSKLLSRKPKLKLYWSVIRPVVVYGWETWVLKESIIQKLSVFERKIQGGSNMTGTDLYVNKPHCAAAVRP